MSLESLTQDLTKHFQEDDYAACAQLLTPIRVQLIKSGLLVPSTAANANPNDQVITRSILEIGALVSLNMQHENEFWNYITLLKPFYALPRDRVPESQNQSKLLSLYLLLVLTLGDLALFHVELEKFQNFGLSPESLEKDEYLSIPVKFEQWIIDGDYNKVYEALSSKHKFPCKEFNLFEPQLLSSIQVSIAENLQSAYTSLPLENLKMLLFLKSNKDAEQFISNFGWTLSNGAVYFDKPKADEEVIDEKSIVKNALVYAREMESII